MSELHRLLVELGRRPLPAGSFEACYAFADAHPESATEIVLSGLTAVPQGSPFLNDMISRIAPDHLDSVAARATEAFASDPTNRSAIEAVHRIALQDPPSLTPHLQRLWGPSALVRSYSRDWPWRAADDREIDRLRRILEDDRLSQGWERAWRCLLETRSEEGWLIAARTVDRVSGGLRNATFSEGQRDLRWVDACFGLVGAAFEDGVVRPVVHPNPLHLAIPEQGLTSVRQSWLARRHPTWCDPDPTLPTATLGGESDSSCVSCGARMRRLLLLDPVPRTLSFVSRPRLDLAYCYSCVDGWEPAWHQHDNNGRPTMIRRPEQAEVPFELEEIRPPVAAGFADCGPRWQRQDWGMSNSRENLNRLGGELTWIQNPHQLRCPNCQRTMMALLQLDWDHLIGGEGITYVLWCDTCTVSGLTFQQT